MLYLLSVKKRLMSKHLFWLFLTAIGLTACVDPRPLDDNTVIAHITSQPDGLHPTNDNSSNRTYIFQYTQRTLMRLDIKSLKVVPTLLTDLPRISDDGLLYYYELMDGVTWDDGTPLTVDDVIFSIKLVLCKLTNNAAIRGNYTSVIKDVYPDPDNPNGFIMEAFEVQVTNKEIFTELYIQQKSYWDPDGVTDSFTFKTMLDGDWEPSNEIIAWFNGYNDGANRYEPNRLVGLGPYQVTQWEGNYIVLKRKENWWGENSDSDFNKAYPEKIIFMVIPDDAAYKIALKNQDVDVSTYIASDILLTLQELDYFNENYYSEFADQYSYTYLGMNTRPDGVEHLPYFEDVRVRRAMAYLVPVDEIIRIVLHGKGSRQVANVSPLKESYNTDLEPIPLDLEKAKELLKEAGWVDTDGDNIRDKEINGQRIPFSFKLNYMTGSTGTKQSVLMIKSQMYKAGIEVIPNPMEFTTFYDMAYDHDFDMMFGAWGGSAGYSDPTQIWHTSQWANKGSNFTGFGDAESDSLITTLNRSMDEEKFDEVYKALQKKLYDDQPYVFLYSYKRKIAIHKRFDEANMYPERPGVTLNELILKPEFGSTVMHPEQPE